MKAEVRTTEVRITLTLITLITNKGTCLSLVEFPSRLRRTLLIMLYKEVYCFDVIIRKTVDIRE